MCKWQQKRRKQSKSGCPLTRWNTWNLILVHSILFPCVFHGLQVAMVNNKTLHLDKVEEILMFLSKEKGSTDFFFCHSEVWLGPLYTITTLPRAQDAEGPLSRTPESPVVCQGSEMKDFPLFLPFTNCYSTCFWAFLQTSNLTGNTSVNICMKG